MAARAPIKNVDTLHEFLAPGLAKHIVGKIAPPDIMVIGVQIQAGHLLIADGVHLPVVAGLSSSNVFGMARQDRYPPLLERGLGDVKGQITDAVFIHGTPNYYHFMFYDLPLLLLLKACGGDRISLVMGHPFIPSTEAVMKAAISTLAKGREVAISLIPEGTYVLNNVLLGTRQKSSLSPYMCKQLLLPRALQKAGIQNPLKDIGPIKLFVRRDKAANGRNLTNQYEVEAWCVARGYTPVNPGAMTLEEQIVLFARATHIVGVEGAAMTNILFAINAVTITMVASPAVESEKFFSTLAKHYAYTFETMYGRAETGAPGDAVRRLDYAIDMAAFDAAMQDKA